MSATSEALMSPRSCAERICLRDQHSHHHDVSPLIKQQFGNVTKPPRSAVDGRPLEHRGVLLEGAQQTKHQSLTANRSVAREWAAVGAPTATTHTRADGRGRAPPWRRRASDASQLFDLARVTLLFGRITTGGL